MNTSDMLEAIKDLNLTYLMLAQHMIRQDKSAAVYRLGVSQELADVLADLTSHGNENMMPQSHAAILLSGQPVEELA